MARMPLYAINADGVAMQVADLCLLSSGHYYVESALPLPFLLGDGSNGLFDDLPYFLWDMRPQGYIGRLIARQLGGSFPENPESWRNESILRYVLDYGHDLPGHLLVGDRALAQWQHQEFAPLHDRAVQYPSFAVASINGELAGSSAGGEQPKFMAYDAALGHVLVKFSPAGDTAADVRWRDVLTAEWLAHQALQQAGIPAASVSLYCFDQRLFLESIRFDRVGRLGRRPMLSLLMINAEFVGSAGSWVDVCQQLHQQRRIDDDDLQRVIWLHYFGQWIANSDMHLGNLSFSTTADGFALLPLYDMLPMRYAPSAQGEVVDRPFIPPVCRAAELEPWKSSANAALAYWRNVSDESSLSDQFRAIAHQNNIMIASVLAVGH
jgi:hypothetical protein